MLDSKDFLKGFMTYLRDYYGLKDAVLPASLQPNLPKLPLFQQTDQETDMVQTSQMPDMGYGDLGMGDGLLGATRGSASEHRQQPVRPAGHHRSGRQPLRQRGSRRGAPPGDGHPDARRLGRRIPHVRGES